MRSFPINDLNKCSVKDCEQATTVIVQRKIGEETMVYGYCSFHSIISATFFRDSQSNRKEIRV